MEAEVTDDHIEECLKKADEIEAEESEKREDEEELKYFIFKPEIVEDHHKYIA